MKIYIASSWKNQHAVEMLTYLLEKDGYTVVSFVRAAGKFHYDISGATKSDLVVYIGPSGTDAWAEVGAAYGAGIPIYGLWSKGEQAGLMRRMVRWFTDFHDLLIAVYEKDSKD